LKISASLNVTGRLHVKGDLVVLGSVVVDKGGELTVDRKRTVHGRVDGVIQDHIMHWDMALAVAIYGAPSTIEMISSTVSLLNIQNPSPP